MAEILQAYRVPTETINASWSSENTKALVRWLDGDTASFEIYAGVLQSDTWRLFFLYSV